MKHQRVIGKFPTEKPPDPDSKNPGAVGTATGAEVRSFLEETNQIYRKLNVNAIAVLRQDGGDTKSLGSHHNSTESEATTLASERVTPLVSGVRAGHGGVS